MMKQGSNHRWLILSVMCLSVFLVVVDNTIVNVALPPISASLGASNSALQWIVDGYSLPFAGLLLAGGAMSDRYGRKRVMQIGLVFFALFSLLAAFSNSVETLIAARALMGAAAAFIFPATLSILTVTFSDPSERAKAFGVWGATSGLAVAFGPLVGGALITHYWYGSIFLINVPIVAICVIAGAIIVPESRSPHRFAFDQWGLMLGTGAIGALVLAIIQGPSWGWLSTTTIVMFTLSGVLLVGFAVYELRRPNPLLDVRVFRIPSFSAGAGAIATAFFGLFGFIFLMTQYFQLVQGYSAFSAGVHTLPFAIVSMIVTPLGAIAALRIGSKFVVTAGLVCMGLALLWVGSLAASANYFGPVVGSMVVLSFGFSLITAPSTAAVMGSLTPDQIGAGAAVNNTTRELGGTLGVAVLGSIFSSLFAPAISQAFSGVGLTASQVDEATTSMQAALQTLHALPAVAQSHIAPEITNAFMLGFHRSCFVAAGVMGAISLLTYLFLPGRQTEVSQALTSTAMAN